MVAAPVQIRPRTDESLIVDIKAIIKQWQECAESLKWGTEKKAFEDIIKNLACHVATGFSDRARKLVGELRKAGNEVYGEQWETKADGYPFDDPVKRSVARILAQAEAILVLQQSLQ